MNKKLSLIISDLTNKLMPVAKEESSAQAESWWILEHVTGSRRTEMLLKKEISLSCEQLKTLDSIVEQRTKSHKPLQYILGTVPFCNLEIFVTPPILIPRPETEEWTAWLIEDLKETKQAKLVILDIGSGSGCITLALAKALPYSTVIGVDINQEAIRLGEKNKTHNKISNALFIHSNLYDELSQYKKTVDMIVSNPPYIDQQDFDQLSEQVKLWEDKRALVAHDRGFDVHKKILQDAHLYLKSGGKVLIECGKGQADELKKIFKQNNFENIEIHNDMEKVGRWITGQLK